MAAETTTFTPVKLFAGDFPPPLTAPVTVLDGEVLSQYEVIASDAAGKVISHIGLDTDFVADASAGAVTKEIETTRPVVGIMVEALSPSGADGAGIAYTSGCFFASQLVWPAGVTTDLLKAKLVEGSNIRVVFQDTGEV